MHLGGLTIGILETSAVRFQLLCCTCQTVSLNYCKFKVQYKINFEFVMVFLESKSSVNPLFGQ